MSRTVTVHNPSLAIAHTGNGFQLQPGTYQVVEIDGAGDAIAYVYGPDEGALVCVNLHDPNITVSVED